MNSALPKSLCSCTSLNHLEIEGRSGSSAGLRGPIPSCLASLTKLEVLKLSHNSLEGVVPALPLGKLSYLALTGNKLTGELPDMKGQFLSRVDLNSNRFASIGSLSGWASLNSLYAQDNRIKQTLTDIFPAAFTKADVNKTVNITGDNVLIDGKVRNVTWFGANHTTMQGTIKSVDPAYKGELELEDGQVFENGVPAGSAVCTNLRSLDLSVNRVHGTIPENILAQAPALLTLRVGNNQLHGRIPDNVACYDHSCGADCKDDSPAVVKAIDELRKNTHRQRDYIEVDYTQGCSVLEEYCGDDEPIGYGKAIRANCRKTCGTTLQELQLHSNRF